jgi:hypothetical protein
MPVAAPLARETVMTQATPALTIEIDRQHQLPIYLQICERFRTAIAAGHLRPGDGCGAIRMRRSVTLKLLMSTLIGGRRTVRSGR